MATLKSFRFSHHLLFMQLVSLMSSAAFVLQLETSLRALAAARFSALDAKMQNSVFIEDPKIANFCLSAFY